MIKKDSFLYEFLYNEAPMENPDVDNAQDNNPGGPGNGPQMPPMGGNDSQMPPMDNNNGGAPAGSPQGPDTQMPPMGGEGVPGTDAMPPMGDGAGATPEMPPMEPGLGGEGESAGANDTVIDVDDLTQAQEKLNTKVNALGHNTSEMNSNLEKVIAMVSDLSNKLDASNREIEAFKADMERRNPTQKEKLELRTRVSAPFDVPVEQYWDNFEKTHPNYEVSDAQKNDKGQFVITRADANDYNPYEMEQSLLGNPLFETKNGKVVMKEDAVRANIRKALRESIIKINLFTGNIM